MLVCRKCAIDIRPLIPIMEMNAKNEQLMTYSDNLMQIIQWFRTLWPLFLLGYIARHLFAIWIDCYCKWEMFASEWSIRVMICLLINCCVSYKVRKERVWFGLKIRTRVQKCNNCIPCHRQRASSSDSLQWRVF